MKKTNIFAIIFMMIVLTLSQSARAQITRQFHIGDTGNQTATNIQVLPDGSGTIIAGYDYNLVGGVISNSKMIIVKMDPAGTSIIWQTKFGIDGTNNLIYNMIITHDNNIVVVGSIGRSSIYTNNIAAIMKFNSFDGSLIWQGSLHDATPTTGGEIFNAVTELGSAGNYALLVVGSHDSRPAASNAMICMYDATGAFVYDETYEMSDFSTDGLAGLCTATDGKSAYICGTYNQTGGQNDNGRVHYYRPGMFGVGPYVAGTMVWSSYFDYILTGVSGKQALEDNFFSDIYLAGSKLIIHGGSTYKYLTTNGNGETIFRLNASNGLSPELWQLQNSNLAYANVSKLVVVDSDHIMNVQAPASAWNDPFQWLTGVQSSSVVTDVTSLTAAVVPTTPVKFKSSSSTPSLHSMLDITIAGSDLYMAGATNDPSGFGNNDIYLVQTPTTLPIDNTGMCDTSDIVWKSAVPVTPVFPTMTRSNFTPVFVTVNPVPTNYQIGTLCTSVSSNPCNGSSFDSVNTTLTDAEGTAANGGCVFQCTATGTTEPGWTMVEYLWNEGGTITTDYSTATVDNQVVILPYSGTETVTVTFYAIDNAGDTCITTRTINLTCAKPPCYDTTCTKLAITNIAGTTDSCTFTACANICTSYTIVGYDWTLSTGGAIVTDHTGAASDCFTFTIPSGAVVTVSVVAHIVDFNYTAGTSPCCEADLSQQVACNQNPKNRGTGSNSDVISPEDIAIFPNPTQNAVTITSKQTEINNIVVIDVNGKKVGEYNYQHTRAANISLNNLPAGTYLLRVNKSVSKTVTKIK